MLRPLLRLAVCLACVCSFASAAELTIDQIRERAGVAIGRIPAGKMLTLHGDSVNGALHQKVELLADSSTAFRFTNNGPFPNSKGSDGELSWTMPPFAGPHRTTYVNKATDQLLVDFISGRWAYLDAPLDFRLLPKTRKGLNLEVKAKGIEFPVTLTLNPKTYLPVCADFARGSSELWTFDKYKAFEGVHVPTVIKELNDDGTTYEIKEGVIGSPDQPAFAYPSPTRGLMTYDSNSSPDVAMKTSASFRLVKAKLDGEDVGWFVLDTGAELTVVDTKIAKGHHFPKIRECTILGMVGISTAQICQGSPLTVGPLTLNHTTCVAMDLSAVSKWTGTPVAGILGYNFFASAVYDFDNAGQTLHVFPSSASLKVNPAWLKCEFTGDIPQIHCGFDGGHQGRFNIDTGSAATIDFHAGSTDRYGYAKRKDFKKDTQTGINGDAKCLVGKVTDFWIGPLVWNDVTARFSLSKEGAFSNPFVDGNIGLGLLSTVRLILDYPHNRIGILELPDTPGDK